MANTWGELSYGIGDWGLQNDGIASTVGVASSVSVNSVDYVGEPGGWGQFTWGFGEWGDLLNPNVDVIGLQLNTSVGNEEAFTDITVNVNTNLLNISLSSPLVTIGVLIQPSSYLLNTTVNSVFGGESIIAGVVTPGTSTTWGQSTFGSYSWNQITGTQSEIGNEFAFTDITVLLNGNQLPVTLSPNYEILLGILEEPIGVLVTSTINSVFAGELVITNVTGITINSSSGTLTINAEANVTANTNLLNTAIGDENITGDANLTLNSLLLNVSTGSVAQIIDVIVNVTAPGSNTTWGSYAWGQQAWGKIIGLEIDQGGEEVVVPSVEVDVIGQQLNTTIGVYSITANANVNASTNTALNISLGDETGLPNTIVDLTGFLLNLVEGTASGQAVNIVSVTGVSATISTGRVYVSAWAVVDIGVTNTWSVVDIAA